MTILALILSVVLVGLAGVHLLWAFGYWFPIREEERLVRTVIGVRNATRMPGPIPCALICVLMLFAAAAPWWPSGWLRTTVLALAAAIFAGRGALTYTRVWRRTVDQEPFATLDRHYYGPLALVLGLGFLVLWIGGF